MANMFFHQEDDVIRILNNDIVSPLDLYITVDRFKLFEPTYSLDVAYVAHKYIPDDSNIFYTTDSQVVGTLPWAEGDAYIANIDIYQGDPPV